MNLNHFQNGLLCKVHRHGASFAIDTLLDLYYFGVFRWNVCKPLQGGSFVNMLK